MSTPATASPTAPPQIWPTLPRLLGVVAFAVVGFVAVWQGFGVAGFGTDIHAGRVFTAVIPLFACGLVLVWPKIRLPVRVIAVLLGLGLAGYAWYSVRSSNFKSAMSLREAVESRDRYKARLATPNVEEAVKSEGERGIKFLFEQYPSLSQGMPAEYDRWAEAVADEIVARYRRAPLDDFKGIQALREPTAIMSKAHPASADRLDAARRQWLSDALGAKTNELSKLRPGAWAEFNNTAFGRLALADALPDTRDILLRAEAEWVDSSAEFIVSNNLTPKPGEAPRTREFWKQTLWDVLALKSLEAKEERFAMARRRLFKVAHDTARAEAAGHFEAGRYDLAFGVARTHAVDWNATAAVLGKSEQESLDAMRTTYQFFDALAEKSAKPAESADIAPPPRTKP